MYLLFWFFLEDAWAYLDWEASDYHLYFTTRAINQWKVVWAMLVKVVCGMLVKVVWAMASSAYDEGSSSYL